MEQDLWQLLDFYADKGLVHLLCTDIGRDGAMTGPNVDLYRSVTGAKDGLAQDAGIGRTFGQHHISHCKRTAKATGEHAHIIITIAT